MHISEIKTRQSLVDHLSNKHEDIMKKFITEIGMVEHEFLKNRKNPPITRNRPPHIGAIRWQQLLFSHLKKSIMVFRKVENSPALQNSYLKRTAFSQYFSLASEMNTFEKQKYSDFLTNGTFVVNSILKRNLLRLNVCGAPKDRIAVKKIKKPAAVPVAVVPVRTICVILILLCFEISLNLLYRKSNLLHRQGDREHVGLQLHFQSKAINFLPWQQL